MSKSILKNEISVQSADSEASSDFSGRRRKSVAYKFQDPKELLMAVTSVVKNRKGSVLGRQMILKSDHFDTGINSKLDIHLHGAPNFRMADMNIFGVAQPTVTGIKTVLALLKCSSTQSNPKPAVWVSAREEPLIYLNRTPFVIRDAKSPLQNISTYQGILTSRLEQMEVRLKDDILQELERWNGLLLVHEERSDQSVVPVWVAIDHIQTPREVFKSLRDEGFVVEYERLPVSPDQGDGQAYLDEFINVVTGRPSDTNLIFNCGMGVGRTTLAMTIAIIIRRFQLLKDGESDPLQIQSNYNGLTEMEKKNRSMIELISLLEEAFTASNHTGKAVEWAMAHSPLLANLQTARTGNYRITQQLQSLLVSGAQSKLILDAAVDRCGILVNTRESILVHRMCYSLTGKSTAIDKAIVCLERYLYMFALCSFLQEKLHAPKEELSFSKWLKQKPDVEKMLYRIRTTTPPLSIFVPCEDLSILSVDISKKGLAAWGPNSNQPATELDKYVIKSRKGEVLVQNTILKEDFWFRGSSEFQLKGAANFRKVQGFPVYGVAQPTLQGLKNVLESICKDAETVIWINLREEPFIYINGVPYVLRDTNVTLRNLKSYQGITPSSLEFIEAKLKKDVINEIVNYENKILLHSESSSGEVEPLWEDCNVENVLSLRDAMDIVKKEMACTFSNTSMVSLDERGFCVDLVYHRVPQTAETSPEAEDMDNLISILSDVKLDNTAIVLNCQIGFGRSTSGTIIVTLILRWLGLKDTFALNAKKVLESKSNKNFNYQLIHSLLRVIRNGIECKRVVDQVIDAAASLVNIRDNIEECRQQMEAEPNPDLKKEHYSKGILALDRYFHLILFQSYLDQNPPGLKSELMSFKDWKESHPEFNTIRDELLFQAKDPLVPVDEMEPGDGIALTNEVLDVVNRRNGAVLSQGTILKFDLFPGAQKMSLKDRIEGAHNYRTVEIDRILEIDGDRRRSRSVSITNVSGVGMPTEEGIRAVLNHVDAGPNGKTTVYWTSLREEPVIYIKGRPYVLRLFVEPIKNLVTTGIARKRVEEMEEQMKNDIIQELKLYKTRVLLHEERVEGNHFLVVPVWETICPADIETTLDLYESMKKRGYRVDYLRIPITDELSPIPDVFDQLVVRILNLPSSSLPIFNCQMGRGRTTQGLVISCLLRLIVGNKTLQQDPDSILPDFDQADDNFHLHSTNNLADGVDASLERGYKAGNYNLILKLIAVLQHGKLAKYLTDQTIDSCDHMQNLRVAIYDFRIRLAAMDPAVRKYQNTFEMGCNYLVRYFYLITFTDYLIESWSTWTVGGPYPIPFTKWLDSRREIQNIIKSPNLD